MTKLAEISLVSPDSQVLFGGRKNAVYTVATDAKDVLVGTKLLRRNILTINFRTKRVLIK